MKKIMRRLIAIIMLVVMTFNCDMGVIAAESDVTNLGKLADSYEKQDGSFSLVATSRFFVVSNSEPTGELLQTVQLVQQQFAADDKPSGVMLDIVWGPITRAKTGDIIVNLDTSSGLAAEAYSLDVSNKAIVTASDVDGLLYGLNMLHKYFRAADSTILSGFKASDTPDPKERTVMLECGRKYYTKNYICNFIREISWMGYNTIELHFSEDGGFRMDFWDPEYYTDNYSPENDFSWICGSLPQSWVLSPYTTDSDKNKYLTTAEIIEILETAKEYHLDVIPSFDSPAHTDYLNWKFEQNYNSNASYSFKHAGTTYKASTVKGCINYTGTTGYTTVAQWPNYSTINIENTTAKAFIMELYEDIADFFKEYAGSTKFNIGADEVNLSYSTTWEYSDFPGYVNELDELLNAKGYTTRAFNDFIGSAKSAYITSLSDFNDDIEILYWNSPWVPNSGTTATDDDNKVQALSYFVNAGRTVYNVIQTNCYYCTRITGSNWTYASKDARDPDNRQWQVYESDEEHIYNDWYPADISERGDYDENVEDVSSSQLGGAYFCIWHDFASMNTESEIWNGAVDKNDSSKTYYLLDRMWSNTIKMWNWDIDNTVTFSTYKTIRDKYGYFPGYTSCSKAASLPTATAPTLAYLADHTALTTALANKLSNQGYSTESYAVYEAAYAAAEAVNADPDATQAELDAKLAALNAAAEALEYVGVTITVTCKANVNGTEKTIHSITENCTDEKYSIYVPMLIGYEYESIEGAQFSASSSRDGSGYVNGSINKSVDVTVWYTHIPTINRLQEVISYADKEQGSYTNESWAEYAAILAEAQAANQSTLSQDEINALVAKFMNVQSKLVTAANTTEFVKIEKLTETARYGKQIGLRITTTPDVATLEIAKIKSDESLVDEELTLCTGKVQTLNTGETVKIWLVDFPADEIGTLIFNVQANGTQVVTKAIEITVK